MNDPRLPKFIVIGVMKCGTGATQHFLHNHPDLAQAKQETYFFNNDHKYKGELKGPRQGLSKFRNEPHLKHLFQSKGV